MTSNHEENSNDSYNFEKFKMSIQFYWGYTYLCRKIDEGTCFEVINLAFSSFL